MYMNDETAYNLQGNLSTVTWKFITGLWPDSYHNSEVKIKKKIKKSNNNNNDNNNNNSNTTKQNLLTCC